MALLMPQGIEVIAAILGLLKAGKIYLPLDTALPIAQLTDLVQHAGAAAVITTGSDYPFRCLHYEDLVASGQCDDPGLAIDGGTPAYIFYTSGTTGRPKAVYDSHRNVLHNVMRYTNGLSISVTDRLTLLQLPHFSGAVSSMYAALLNGATVYPLDPRGQSPTALTAWVHRHSVTMWHSVPSLFRQLCAAKEQFPSLRVVRLEGDQSSPADVALFQNHCSRGSYLANGLGATETGLSRRFLLAHVEQWRGKVVPIGFPVEDVEVFVTDDCGAPVMPGVTGEITVRSRYLALGYWRDPERTSQSFINDPTSYGERIYRSGDLGRIDANGCLDHLGRSDSRVKLRGHWVDLGDVEGALASLAGVSACTVVVQNNRLAAFIVPAHAGHEPRADTIRRQLLPLLPAHAVPNSYTFLEELPLNRNGKVDRSMLPTASTARPALSIEFAAPQTAAEQKAAALWQQILNVDKIGLDDNFFDLGGDSLGLASAVADWKVDLAAFLERPTIRHLVSLGSNGPRQAENLVVSLRRAGAPATLVCLPGHEGALAGFANLVQHLGPELDVCACVPPPVPERGSLLSIPQLAEMYVRLLSPGTYLLAGICFGGYVAYEMAQLLQAQGRGVPLLVLIECFREGWIDEQPRTTRWLKKAELLAGRGLFHSRVFLKKDYTEAIANVRLRSQVRHQITAELALQKQFDECVATGQPLPLALSEPRFANRFVARSWSPSDYSGAVLQISGAEPRDGVYRAPMMGWQGLLTGPVESHYLSDNLNGVLARPTVAKTADLIYSAYLHDVLS